MIPMVASIAAVVTNFCLNLILIFGLLGAPKLGAVGAAIATVTSRFVELAVLAVWTHKNKLRCPFAVGAFRFALHSGASRPRDNGQGYAAHAQ